MYVYIYIYVFIYIYTCLQAQVHRTVSFWVFHLVSQLGDSPKESLTLPVIIHYLIIYNPIYCFNIYYNLITTTFSPVLLIWIKIF